MDENKISIDEFLNIAGVKLNTIKRILGKCLD